MNTISVSAPNNYKQTIFCALTSDAAAAAATPFDLTVQRSLWQVSLNEHFDRTDVTFQSHFRSFSVEEIATFFEIYIKRYIFFCWLFSFNFQYA